MRCCGSSPGSKHVDCAWKVVVFPSSRCPSSGVYGHVEHTPADAFPLVSRAAMRFFEYESRKILERERIPVAPGGYAKTADDAKRIAAEVGGPVVIKSQVLTGGRMKAGGVRFADTPEEAEAQAKEILELEINGHMPRGLLVGAKAEIKQEYYAGVVWDGIRKLPTCVFSDIGGIDIEQV